MNDTKILEIALGKMSEALNELVSECTDNDGKPVKPSYSAIMKARGYLPPTCDNAFKKKSDD